MTQHAATCYLAECMHGVMDNMIGVDLKAMLIDAFVTGSDPAFHGSHNCMIPQIKLNGPIYIP
jgi:hypothetical protein